MLTAVFKHLKVENNTKRNPEQVYSKYFKNVAVRKQKETRNQWKRALFEIFSLPFGLGVDEI